MYCKDITEAFFIFEMSNGFTVQRCNFIYARDKGTAFPTPIFAALTNDKQHFVQISDIEFDPA